MAAPTLFIPTDATWTAELAARTALTGDVHWLVEIDPDGGGYHDYTANLDNNQVQISASSSIFKAAEATQATLRFRNSPKVWGEGDLANCAIKISVSIGAASAIRVFTGYVSAQGCSRERRFLTSDRIALTAYDPARYRGLQRKCAFAALLNYKVCDPADTTHSLAHALAAQMGLSASDLDFGSITEVKDYLGLDGETAAWTELQDLALQYGAFLGFRYDGKLRLLLWTAAEWAAPNIEYTFDDSNVHSIRATGGDIFCNVAKTEYTDYQALAAGSIIYKNYDSWDSVALHNAIEVAAGEYWPGGADSAAVARLEYGYNGERYPIGTSIITPTIGAVGSGSDIECSGGTLTLTSFNGSTAATQQNLDSSEIILYNNTAGTITIRKFEVRGTPLREMAKIKVENVDAGVANDWDKVEQSIPGKYATTTALAKQIVRRWTDFGHEPRKEYEVEADFTPNIQCGAVVHFHPLADVELDCVVTGYTHTSRGPHSGTRTSVRLLERVDYADTGAGDVTHNSQPTGNPYMGEYVVGASVYGGACTVRCDGTDDHSDINTAIQTAKTLGLSRVRCVGGPFYLGAAVEMDSSITLEIGAGASIVKDANDYAIECVGTSGTHKSGVRLTGSGTITRDAGDTNAKPLVFFDWVDDFVIEGVTVDDSYDDGVLCQNCSNGKVEASVKILDAVGWGLKVLASTVVVATAITITGCGNGATFLPPATNLMYHGDCESTDEPMLDNETTPVLTDCTWARDGARSRQGSYSYKFTHTSNAGRAYFVDGSGLGDLHGLSAGKNYFFRCYIYNQDCTDFCVQYSVDAAVTSTPTVTTTGEWVEVMANIVLPVGTTGFRMWVYSTCGTSGKYLNVDDVEFYEIPEVDSGCALVNSSISNCTDTGVLVANSHVQLQGNQVTGNTERGIVIAAGYRNQVTGNRCFNNGSDTGVGNANQDNFYDAGIDTQISGCSWQQPVTGEVSLGTPHKHWEEILNVDPASTDVQTLDVSSFVPAGTTWMEGIIEHSSGTANRVSRVCNVDDSEQYDFCQNYIAGQYGRSHFSCPVTSDLKIYWKVSSTDVTSMILVMTRYYC